MATLNTITAIEIARDFDANDGDSRYSLAAGRGYPGVITAVDGESDWDDVIWITWLDGNGEHQSRYQPTDELQVIVG